MQSASSVLMIRPACFFYNEETGKSNVFQHRISLNVSSLTRQVQEEFDVFVAVLRQHEVEVLVLEDTLLPAKPDALFPNNWISFHSDGKAVSYPMESVSRRSERRLEIIQEVSQHFDLKELIDLSHFEMENKFLEGTGSLILDRENKRAYAGLSSRTNVDVIQAFAEKMQYEAITFKAVDQNGKAIYHSNVMMSIGEKFALVCWDAIKDLEERQSLITSFSKTDKEVIPISFDQMNAFAGNLLQLKSKAGKKLIILSTTAYKALDRSQLRILSNFGELLPISIPTIEQVGGGSVRCMTAEIFLKSNFSKA